MKFTITQMVVHKDGTSHVTESDTDAEHWIDAIIETIGEGESETLPPFTDTDTFVVYATPQPQTDDDQHQREWDASIDAMQQPTTREECLQRAKEKEDPGWRIWWENEAEAHRPAAEGGGPIPELHEALRKKRHDHILQLTKQEKPHA